MDAAGLSTPIYGEFMMKMLLGARERAQRDDMPALHVVGTLTPCLDT